MSSQVIPSPATTIVSIGSNDYLVHPIASATVQPPAGTIAYLPCTVTGCDAASFGDDQLDRLRARYEAVDDVWHADFLQIILLRSTSSSVNTSSAYRAIHIESKQSRLPDGPYLIDASSGGVHAVSRLFNDVNDCFVGGIVPSSGDKAQYKWLTASNLIPVPSRLYSSYNESKPLAGFRFAVKDAIDIHGLETGCGSRDYRQLYPPKAATSPAISRLLDAGAVLVGKTRLAQFCDGQDPLERFEEPVPINPRGDSFQKPSSSSSGSAASCASYPWLDFTIGTDTGGSTRHPAGVNGLYGIRPSLNSIENSGLLLSPLMDTVGVFARSAALAQAVIKHMAKESLPAPTVFRKQLRFKILYAIEPESSAVNATPKFFPRPERTHEYTSESVTIFENAIQSLEKHLGCTRQAVCLETLWSETNGFTTKDLVKATTKIYQDTIYPSLAHNTIDPFAADFRKAASQRLPFIEPILKARVDYGRQVSDADRRNAEESLQRFAQWVNSTLLKTSAEDEIPLLIFPQSWGVPSYRDEGKKDDGPLFWEGFSVYSISYCSGCPDITVPIGEASYQSKITEQKEYLPLSISVLSRLGTDDILLNLLKELEEKGIIRPVRTGSRI